MTSITKQNLQAVLSVIDEHKDEMEDNVYLNICNGLKTLYNKPDIVSAYLKKLEDDKKKLNETWMKLRRERNFNIEICKNGLLDYQGVTNEEKYNYYKRTYGKEPYDKSTKALTEFKRKYGHPFVDTNHEIKYDEPRRIIKENLLEINMIKRKITEIDDEIMKIQGGTAL